MRPLPPPPTLQRRNMKPEIWKNYYDVVVLPPKPVAGYAIRLSKQLYSYGATWVLGKRHFISHISLYHVPVKPRKFQEFLAALRVLAKRQRGGVLQTAGLEGGLLTIDRPKWLRELHWRILELSLRYFDHSYGVEKTWNSVKKLPSRRRAIALRNIKKYGTPFVGRSFCRILP